LQRGYPETQLHYLSENPTVRFFNLEERKAIHVSILQLIEGQDTKSAATVIEKHFPPSSERNADTASTVSFGELLELKKAHEQGTFSVRTNQIAVDGIRIPSTDPPYFPDLPDAERQTVNEHGLSILGDGKVAVIVPAAGTGRRFGGYQLPEDHPDRQKVLTEVLEIGGQSRCALEVRAAHLKWWLEKGVNVPMLVMGSHRNSATIKKKLVDKHQYGLAQGQVTIYTQHGIFRLNPTGDDLRYDMETITRIQRSYEQTSPGMDWYAYRDREIDEMLAANGTPGDFFRKNDGRVSLAPAGHQEAITLLVLNRQLLTLARKGISHIVMANGDDTGFVLDPAKLGYFDNRPEGMMAVFVRRDITYTLSLNGNNYQIIVRHRDVISSDLPIEYSVRVHEEGTLEITKEGEAAHYEILSTNIESGGYLMEYADDEGGFRSVIVEHPQIPSTIDLVRLPYFHTAQLYFKVSALLELFGLTDLDEYERMSQEALLARVRRTLEASPPYLEVKDLADVSVDGSEPQIRKTVQVSRTVGALSYLLRMVPIVIDRTGQEGLGGHWTLKTRGHIDAASSSFAKAPWRDMFVFAESPTEPQYLLDDRLFQPNHPVLRQEMPIVNPKNDTPIQHENALTGSYGEKMESSRGLTRNGEPIDKWRIIPHVVEYMRNLAKIGRQSISVLEAGATKGGMLGAIQQALVDADPAGEWRHAVHFTAIDINPDLITVGKREHPDFNFILLDLITGDLTPYLGTQDVVLCPNVLHEIYSAVREEDGTIDEQGGEDLVTKLVERTIGMLKPDGLFAVFDGVLPEHGNEFVRIRFKNAAARDRFRFFVETYAAFKWEPEWLENNWEVRLPMKALARYLIKCYDTPFREDWLKFEMERWSDLPEDFQRYIQLKTGPVYADDRVWWEIERFETSAYFTPLQFRELFKQLGIDLRHIELLVSFPRVKQLDHEMVSEGLTLPPQKILITGTKNSTDESAAIAGVLTTMLSSHPKRWRVIRQDERLLALPYTADAGRPLADDFVELFQSNPVPAASDFFPSIADHIASYRESAEGA